MGFFTGRVRGYTLATLAVLSVSPDACLLRYIRRHAPSHLVGDPAWSGLAVLICCKYMMMGCIQMIFIFCASTVEGGTLVRRAANSWRALAAPTVFMLINQIGFTIGLLETTAANAITLLSLNPLWAALMGCIALGDRVHRHTVITIVVAFCAIACAFVPTIVAAATSTSTESEQPLEGASLPSLHGDAIALASSVSLAAFLTSSRAGSLQDKDAPMEFAPALGSLGASLLAAPMAYLACRGSLQPVLRPAYLGFCLADAMLEALFDIWIGQAAKYITSAEVALVLLLEIPLGPLFVFLAFRELPPIYTIFGSTVLLVALVIHGMVDIRADAAAGEDGEALEISNGRASTGGASEESVGLCIE